MIGATGYGLTQCGGDQGCHRIRFATLTLPLTSELAKGYPAGVMNETANNPPVVELPETSERVSASGLMSFYYWFTDPPAPLAGQFG